VLCVGIDPVEDFAVTFARCELLAQSFWINAEKVDYVLIERAVVVELAVGACNFGAALVKHTRQNSVAAEPAARTARRAFCKIGSRDVGFFRHICF
jgi:hypothetical protein